MMIIEYNNEHIAKVIHIGWTSGCADRVYRAGYRQVGARGWLAVAPRDG
jgi:hypothetical protein